MKKLFMLFCFLPSIGFTTEDLSWTFLWGTNSVGVVFQTTNLEFAVKSSISDDVVRILGFNVPSNSTYTAFNTGDTLFGVVTGRIAMAHAFVPSNSPLRYYNTYNGTIFFVVDAVACTKYLTKIALTNQCPLATDSLATFITTLNQVTTNTVSPSAFASLYWSLQNDRTVTLTGDFEDDITGCLKRINDMSTEEHLLLSILDISNEFLFGKTWLMAEIKIRKKSDPKQVLGDLPVVYREGQWHLIPGYEMP